MVIKQNQTWSNTAMLLFRGKHTWTFWLIRIFKGSFSVFARVMRMFTTQSNAEKVAERLNNSASQATKHDLSWLARVGNVLGMTRRTCFGDVTGLQLMSRPIRFKLPRNDVTAPLSNVRKNTCFSKTWTTSGVCLGKYTWFHCPCLFSCVGIRTW